MNRFLTAVFATFGGSCALGAVTIFDQIGPDATATNGHYGNASQSFIATNTAYDIAAIDDFTITQTYLLTSAEAVFTAPTTWDPQEVTSVTIAIYSNVAGLSGSSMDGDVANLTPTGTTTLDDPFGTNTGGRKVTVDLTDLGCVLQPGTYWMAIIPSMYLTFGQIFITQSSIGSPANARQINPGNGFGLGTNFQITNTPNQVDPVNLGYRLSGNAVPEPLGWMALGIGLGSLLIRRRTAKR